MPDNGASDKRRALWADIREMLWGMWQVIVVLLLIGLAVLVATSPAP